MRWLFFYSVFILSVVSLALLAGCDTDSALSNQSNSNDTTKTKPKGPTYTNPVVTSAAPVSADPSIIRVNGAYYLYATANNWADGTGAHNLPIFKSKDLVHWSHIGDVFDAIPSWGHANFLWAPDISQKGDTFYIYYVSKQKGKKPCIGMATSKFPYGPWKDLGHAVFCAEDVGAPHSIDPFIWDDGQSRTIIWGHGGIYALKLNKNGTAPLADDPAKAKVELAVNRSKHFEAPYIFRHDGHYYLFVSAGTCCNGANSTYRVYVGRSKSLTGPYLDAQRLDLRKGGGTLVISGNKIYAGPGHIAVTTDDAGHDWLVYHAIPRKSPRLSNGVNRRQGMIDRIYWKNGWPVVNRGDGPSYTPQPAPIINNN